MTLLKEVDELSKEIMLGIHLPHSTMANILDSQFATLLAEFREAK